MPHDSDRADAPSRWLSNARADLAIARITLPPGGLYEQLCFHAQQAAEKSIKAVLLDFGKPLLDAFLKPIVHCLLFLTTIAATAKNERLFPIR